MYVTYTNLGKYGRLGNQMFQYAAILGLADKLDCEAVVPDTSNVYWHGQLCPLNRLFNLSATVRNETPDTIYHVTGRGTIDHDFFRVPRCRIDIQGHPESEFYFKHIKDKVVTEFAIRPEFDVPAREYIKSIKSVRDVVGVHLRRGDHATEYTFAQESKWLVEYYRKAFELFHTDDTFVVFTGGSRDLGNSNTSDIEWCKYFFTKYFPEKNVTYSDIGTVEDDLARMVSCDHLILNSPSTLGWWAGYLRPKKVVVPDMFYPPVEITGYWPSHFTVVPM